MQVTEGSITAVPPTVAKAPARARSRHDLKFTLITAGIGLVLGAGMTLLVREGVVAMATEPLTWGTCLFEVLLYVLLFDGYFYAVHRLLHTKWMFKRIHAVHHKSTSPTVLTAMAFHPVEALMITGFMPAAMVLVPIHFVSLVIVSLFLSGSLVIAHSGYEVFPRWMAKVPVLNVYVTPKVHDEHHKRANCNYSATISIYDRLFGTYVQK